MTEPPVKREREVSAAAAERDIIIAVSTNTRLLPPPRGERDRDEFRRGRRHKQDN
jgi:hypothetical protein